MNFKRTMLIVFMTVSSLSSSLAFSETNDKSTQPIFSVQRVYLKELAIEQPNSPAIFLEMDTPKIDIKLDTASEKLNATTYESTVSVVLTGKIKNKVAFVVKAKQAGIFTIDNVPQSQIDKLLGSRSPIILYPYLRGNVADIMTRGGFPPAHLAELDWDKWYLQRLGVSP